MAKDLKMLQKTKVSKDLKGKFVFLYGAPKIGKTTLAVQFPKNLLFAVEKGYNALDDIYAVDIPTWGEFKKYVNQLSDPELQETFNTITIDTISLAYDRCVSYVCDRERVNSIGEVPYGAGYSMVDKEFSNELIKITQYGYGLVLIGHEKLRVDSDGQTSVKHISPDIPDRCAKIINRMVDLTAYIGMENQVRYIYPRQVVLEEGKQVTEIMAGSHFANLNDKIELGYEPLVNAIADAMTTGVGGKEIKLSDDPVEVEQEVVLDFNAISSDIKAICKKLYALDEKDGQPVRVNEYKKIVENYLGKNKLVKDCDESQVEHLSLILDDLRRYVKSQKIEI